MGTLGGVQGVDRRLLDVARTLRLGKWRTTAKIVVPAAVPSVAVGLRLALALSVALAVVAEMLGNPAGLGFGMVFSQRAFHADEVFAYLLVIGALGWALNALFVGAVRRLAPGFRGSV
jgi:sulfonate transport system permease protein